MANPRIRDAIFMVLPSVHLPSRPIEGTGTLGRENGGKWAGKLQAGNLVANASSALTPSYDIAGFLSKDADLAR